MLTVIFIILLLWFLGLIGHVGGGLINLLLIVALIVFIIDHTRGREL